MQIQRSSHRYRSRRDPQDGLRLRLRDLAAVRPRYGYRRLHILLRREGMTINHKIVLRLYREENLQVRTKRRRKVTARPRVRLPAPSELNHRWSLDFVSDELASGRRFRVLTVIDMHSRECLALAAGVSLPATTVTRVLDGVIAKRGVPVALTLACYVLLCQGYRRRWAVQSRDRYGHGLGEPAHRASSGLVPEERRVPGEGRSSCLRQEEPRTTVGISCSPARAGASGLQAAIRSSFQRWSTSKASRCFTTANA